MVLFYKLKEMQEHSLSEKSVDLRQEHIFNQYSKTYTEKLETESFFRIVLLSSRLKKNALQRK